MNWFENKNQDLIVSSNALIEAKYDFTLWQKRVFVYMITCIEKSDKDFKPLRIWIKDLINFYGVEDGETTYSIIRSVPTELLNKKMVIPYQTTEGYMRERIANIFSAIDNPKDNKDQNQYIELKFNDDLKPELLALKERFTKYYRENVIYLNSVYSFRMYEILKSWQPFGNRKKISIERLKYMLAAENKYKLNHDFKRFVLDKAMKDLTEFCDITFSYREIKQGKKVAEIEFDIRENKPQERSNAKRKKASEWRGYNPDEEKLDIQNKITEVEESTASAVYEQLYEEFEGMVVKTFGVSRFVFMDLIRQYPDEHIRQAIRVTERAKNAEKTTNTAGFFVEALKKGYTDESEERQKRRQSKKEKEAEMIEVQKALDRLAEQHDVQIIEKVREITTHEPDSTQKAIEEANIRFSYVVESIKKQLNRELTLEDYRKNEILRGIVMSSFQILYREAFEEIEQSYRIQHQVLITKLEALKKG